MGTGRKNKSSKSFHMQFFFLKLKPNCLLENILLTENCSQNNRSIMSAQWWLTIFRFPGSDFKCSVKTELSRSKKTRRPESRDHRHHGHSQQQADIQIQLHLRFDRTWAMEITLEGSHMVRSEHYLPVLKQSSHGSGNLGETLLIWHQLAKRRFRFKCPQADTQEKRSRQVETMANWSASALRKGSSDTKFKPVINLWEFRPCSVITCKVSRESGNLTFTEINFFFFFK